MYISYTEISYTTQIMFALLDFIRTQLIKMFCKRQLVQTWCTIAGNISEMKTDKQWIYEHCSKILIGMFWQSLLYWLSKTCDVDNSYYSVHFRSCVLCKVREYRTISNIFFLDCAAGPFHTHTKKIFLPHWCSDNDNSANLWTRQATKYSENVLSNPAAS